MEPTLYFAIIFGAAIVAGALGALLGLGGGIVVVPVLTLLGGLDLRYAVGASIVSVIATSSGAAATYVEDHITNLRLAMFLEVATTTGAVAGALVAGWLPVRAVSVVFGLVLAFVAVTSFRRQPGGLPAGHAGSALAARLGLSGEFTDPALGAKVSYNVTGVPQGFAMMGLAGVISGLLGIGSGAFKVIAMERLMRVPFKVSTTTSNFMIGVTAAASAGVYFFRGDINPFVAAPVALGVLLGTLVGTRLLLRLRARVIRALFVVVLVVLAAQMVFHGLAGTVR
jgi:uncharacterized protein